jgi:hypothetical protein
VTLTRTQFPARFENESEVRAATAGEGRGVKSRSILQGNGAAVASRRERERPAGGQSRALPAISVARSRGPRQTGMAIGSEVMLDRHPEGGDVLLDKAPSPFPIDGGATTGDLSRDWFLKN